MKKSKFLLLGVAGLFLASCGGYTEDQSKAADEFCACMENIKPVTGDEEMDFDITFAECDLKLMQNYDNTTFADEGWALALEEKCPFIAGELAE
ncbi:MAG: hypothetical protein MK078_13125 [Crocinitomicaceae bacterium]|nr:hypothetical protein [Crocinitomicaceae bacterium]